jgi:hypothetical protein
MDAVCQDILINSEIKQTTTQRAQFWNSMTLMQWLTSLYLPPVGMF